MILCLGEILWDCLPAALFLGGAPFNVAAHLRQLGQPAQLASAVGADQFGDEIRRRLPWYQLDEELVAVLAERATGSVRVQLHRGQPTYDIVDAVAYDAIPDTPALRQAARQAEALVFGSLAQRHRPNQELLSALFEVCPGRRVFDVNLRPPHIDWEWLRKVAATVDLIKLNDEELPQVLEAEVTDLSQGAAALAARFDLQQVCLTAGSRGAGLWDRGVWYWAEAPPIEVRDTVGAGDSFLACLLDGLLAEREPVAVLERCVCLAAHVAASDGAVPAHPAEF